MHYLGGAFWSSSPAATATFYRDACGLDIASEAVSAAEDATEGGWWWPHADFAIVCDRPTVLSRDSDGQLHAERGPAIAWEDGFALYFWHGKPVERHIVEQSGGAALLRLRSSTHGAAR